MHKIDFDSYLSDGPETHLEKRIDRKRRRLSEREKRLRMQSEWMETGAIKTLDHQPGFNPSFLPAGQERRWLLEYLEEFYQNQVITDILGKVKGGKEATVYCCAAHPSTGLDLIAAKIYRPAMFRNLRNDALYRQGRMAVNEEGKAVHRRREALAVRKNTRFGQELRHISWLETEFQTMQLLYDAGVSLPRPIAHSNDVILMEYVGTEKLPAPSLNQVHLQRGEARAIFDRLIHDLDAMLACRRIHADLSAYNVLYWEGEVKIIDFPQAVNPQVNPAAAELFTRDVERLCQYFARYQIRVDPHAIANDLWSKYQVRGEIEA